MAARRGPPDWAERAAGRGIQRLREPSYIDHSLPALFALQTAVDKWNASPFAQRSSKSHSANSPGQEIFESTLFSAASWLAAVAQAQSVGIQPPPRSAHGLPATCENVA